MTRLDASIRGRGDVIVLLARFYWARPVVTGPRSATIEVWRRTSDVGRIGMGLAAIAGPAIKRDRSCAAAVAASLAGAHLAAALLKRTIPEMRPDAADMRSFPSAHTAEMFAATASLAHRYGWKAGVPAALVAALVGTGRVKSRRHHWRDVAAGAAIGGTIGYCLAQLACPAAADGGA